MAIANVTTHYDSFRLYFKDRDELTNEDGKLRTFGRIKRILGKNRLRNLGFDVPSGKCVNQQSVIINKTGKEIPLCMM